MALKYHLVQRPDKSKEAVAGSKLYYGQIRAQQKLEFNKLCGNFRMIAGSKGTAAADDFTTNLFKKGHIVFTPGSLLKEVSAKPKFEKIIPITPPGSGGSGEDRPEIN